jgi:hypothetical protein
MQGTSRQAPTGPNDTSAGRPTHPMPEGAIALLTAGLLVLASAGCGPQDPAAALRANFPNHADEILGTVSRQPLAAPPGMPCVGGTCGFGAAGI